MRLTYILSAAHMGKRIHYTGEVCTTNLLLFIRQTVQYLSKLNAYCRFTIYKPQGNN